MQGKALHMNYRIQISKSCPNRRLALNELGEWLAKLTFRSDRLQMYGMCMPQNTFNAFLQRLRNVQLNVLQAAFCSNFVVVPSHSRVVFIQLNFGLRLVCVCMTPPSSRIQLSAILQFIPRYLQLCSTYLHIIHRYMQLCSTYVRIIHMYLQLCSTY